MNRDHANLCILGAGLTGLSAAYHLGDRDYFMLEKAVRVGGNCRTEEKSGFHFDAAGHIFYPKTDYVKELVTRLLGENRIEADRQAWIYSHRTYTRYPFQANLYGLPADVIKECLLGLHDAHVREAREGSVEPAHFLDFIYRTFGDGIAKHFMIPFNNKHWRVPLDQLNLEWMGKFVPRPTFAQVLDGSLKPAEKCIGQNATFMYPKRGGIQAVCDSFLPHIRPPELNAEITGIDLKKRTLEINHGRTIGYEKVVSTLPLPVLVRCLKDLPTDIAEAAAKLRWNSLYIVNIAVDTPSLTERHRVYVPDADLVFHKLAFYSAYAPLMAPPNQCAASAEVGYSVESPQDRGTIEERVITGLRRMDILKPEHRILFTHVMDMPFAYAVYDEHRAPASGYLREFFARHDVHCRGRYAEWEYQNMEKNILTGQRVAEEFRPSAG
ncbi:MAG: FAD-dependent oxidoreductase [Verrucomicrobia bacterium]|nr:FAD-dependent oxidoreductase [Verrucomicrobiota bacterium]MBU1909991.1 FAD-dependent oxidoreductase [Verrucomicrobiota bacterium]